MIREIKFYKNDSNGGAFYLEETEYGESAMKDRRTFALIGYVQKSRDKWELYSCEQHYDMTNDNYVEMNKVICSKDSREEAESFGKQYWKSSDSNC